MPGIVGHIQGGGSQRGLGGRCSAASAAASRRSGTSGAEATGSGVRAGRARGPWSGVDGMKRPPELDLNKHGKRISGRSHKLVHLDSQVCTPKTGTAKI